MEKRIAGGFDVRVQVGAHEEDSRQTNQYLLPGIRIPASADPSVWRRPDNVELLIAAENMSYPLGLNNDSMALFSLLRERNISIAALVAVCLTIDLASAERFKEIFGKDYFLNAPSQEDLLSHGWCLLGFDVVELNGLTSGLKGIGYIEPSWSQMRASFAAAMNEVGLFADEHIASRFAKLRSFQVPAHSPFEVVGVLVRNMAAN